MDIGLGIKAQMVMDGETTGLSDRGVEKKKQEVDPHP